MSARIKPDMRGADRPILIRGGRLIDPSHWFDAVADLLIDGGVIAGLEARGIVPPEGTLVLEAAGLVVTPGFIDLHTHLRFPGFPDKETIASGTEAAAAGGFSTV